MERRYYWLRIRLESEIKDEQKEKFQILMDNFSDSLVSALKTLKKIFPQGLK